jgi:hypothetical protein
MLVVQANHDGGAALAAKAHEIAVLTVGPALWGFIYQAPEDGK